MFCKKGVLRNFAKFTGQLTKKEALAQVFSCEFYKISKNTFCYRTTPVAASEYKLLFNKFHTTALFLYPLTTSENQTFPAVFKGYKMSSVAWNWLTQLHLSGNFISPENQIHLSIKRYFLTNLFLSFINVWHIKVFWGLAYMYIAPN